MQSIRHMPAVRLAGRRMPQQVATRRFSQLAYFKPPTAKNEPNPTYAKGTRERAALQAAVESLKKAGAYSLTGKLSTQGAKAQQKNPAAHDQVVAEWQDASAADVKKAIDVSLTAKKDWESLPFADRAAVFLKAADLIAGKYRYELMAATMLGQGKNAWQAEIDTAAELADFLRYNVTYAEQMYKQQVVDHAKGLWNRLEYRPLEGFVYAISPFNFTAIGGNLCAAPALMGNVVIWKPSPFAVAANYLVYKIFLEAGLPEGVIQFIPGDAEMVTKVILDHPDFAALHYTGSTQVFRSLYGKVGANIANGTYKTYPRMVGETGGKNFHLIHKSADVKNAAANTVRGAFEFQGQKCSATSRVYVPKSLWEEFKTEVVSRTEALKVGPPEEWHNFIGPVIHEASFKKLSGVIDEAKNDKELTLLTGGTYDKSKGYFITPTVYQTTNPDNKLMSTELFGPVLCCYVYDDAAPQAYEQIIKKIDSTSIFGLTGAVFAQERAAIRYAEENLRNAAGNFYINAKSTAAVVGQQPFGGARASGTNDKAGCWNILSRFVSMRAIKEEFSPNYSVEYPSNEA
ncbi:Delta-1-pyrroline-5-carboxylate dehydrogenase 1 [Ascosphaera apis ARSEF 7405]|uniref:Multifunctional fusion protein n=1 Tax=Ascosphaera apis ARSEF 7405 TaxID=392613 RepID=A0A167Z9B7_9EURO|nr:Delta-1-pyrroline-5-carboxylate dehydrogenase 1 [Ascosphaera apis ARSEF 7405]